MNTCLAVLLFCTALAALANCNSTNFHDASLPQDDQEKFIAEKEWKPIKPGQKVPGGLHYRINLETGEKEAKLLSEAEPGSPQAAAALYHPGGAGDKKDGKPEESAAKKREALVQFTEKFKKALKTESQLMVSLLQDYAAVRDDNVKCDILQKMEFLVHKYDVGRDFVVQSGHKLLLPDLNSTNPHVRANVAFTLGSAMQGNPVVQSAVMGADGTLFQLLHLVTQDPHPQVALRSLYALSCLLRQNPLGQEKFLAQGGVPLLLQACRHKDLSSPKLRRKALTLFSDLVNEQKLHLQHHIPPETGKEEISNLYKMLNLKERLVENGFCEDILQLGESCREDLDLTEKVVEAMSSLHPDCHPVFASHLATLHQVLSCTELSDPFSQMAKSLLDFYLPKHGEL